LGDFFDNQVPSDWREENWETIRLCRYLDWLILTKRPQNILRMLPRRWGAPPPDESGLGAGRDGAVSGGWGGVLYEAGVGAVAAGRDDPR
jgi:hypothetical protein